MSLLDVLSEMSLLDVLSVMSLLDVLSEMSHYLVLLAVSKIANNTIDDNINGELNKISEWLKLNKLSLNI